MERRNLLRAAAFALLLGAAPVEEARGPFMIFFDYESDAITPQAAQVLDAWMALWRARPGRVFIDGHADLSHSRADSMDISRRRAWRVHDDLVIAGVPPEAIIVRYHGEEEPLVSTEDGVREPQNRRVEIRLEPAGPR